MIDGELRIGVSKLDLTPPLATAYLAFHPRQMRFGGVHDRLHARAFVAEAGDRRLGILSADSLGFSRSILGDERDFIEEIRQRVEAACGIPPDHLMITTTHAHSTPQTTDLHDLVGAYPDLRDWVERLQDQLVAAVVAAWSCRERAELRAGVGHAPGIAWNRRILTTDGRLVIHRDRPPDAQVVKEPKDDRVPVILVRGETRRAALMGFSCHPTTVQVQPLVSADFPGVACDLTERHLDLASCLFIQGACGDVGPIRRTSDFDDVLLYGRSLAGEASRQLALLDAPDQPAMVPALGGGLTKFDVPRRALPDADELRREVAAAEEEIRHSVDDDARQAAIARYRRAFEPYRLCQLGGGPIPLEVQALRLGDVLFVSAEGELFSEFGLEIIRQSPAPITIIAGYTNGYQGYFPTRAAWAEGGYEPSVGPWTRVDESGGERLTAEAIAVARRVWAESA